ncbi:hypothetical protein [Nocardia sp. MH4]|nr:hypothetical protein [Nocardia sp. MH4]
MNSIETPGNNGACHAGDIDALPRKILVDGADSYRKPTQMDERNG